jgi:hypothetical protein
MSAMFGVPQSFGDDKKCTSCVKKIIFWDDDNNKGCPTVNEGGTGAYAVNAPTDNECIQIPSPIHDKAAQITIYPSKECKGTVGGTLWLYDYDGCRKSKVELSIHCDKKYEHFNLNCMGFADKPASYRLECDCWNE